MFALAILFLLCVGASASSLSEDEQAVRGAVPPGGEQLMEEVAPGSSFGDGLRALAGRAFPLMHEALHDAIRSVGVMLAALVLCAFADDGSGRSPAILAGVLSLTSAGMLELHSLARSGEQAMTELAAFSDVLLPAMTAATAASGGLTASAAIYAGTALFSNVLMRAMTELLLPMVYAYAAMCAACAVCKTDLLSRVAKLIRWVFQTGLKTFLFLFTAYLSITGLISGSADGTMLKAAKLTLSGVVPVVGSMISDASETVLVGAAAVRNSVGVFGMLAVIAVCLGPFLRIGIQVLLLKAAGAVGAALGPKPLLSLLDAIGEAMGFLLAMTGTMALMLLISCVCYLKVTPG